MGMVKHIGQSKNLEQSGTEQEDCNIQTNRINTLPTCLTAWLQEALCNYSCLRVLALYDTAHLTPIISVHMPKALLHRNLYPLVIVSLLPTLSAEYRMEFPCWGTGKETSVNYMKKAILVFHQWLFGNIVISFFFKSKKETLSK